MANQIPISLRIDENTYNAFTSKVDREGRKKGTTLERLIVMYNLGMIDPFTMTVKGTENAEQTLNEKRT